MKAKERLKALDDRQAEQVDSDEAAAVAYLKAHPDFFRQRTDLLCDLEIPHGSGAAVSLVEHQVSLLRERNVELRHRLMRIIETARSNDLLFDKTRQLVLQLIEFEQSDTLIECARRNLLRELNADFCVVTLFSADNSAEARQALPAVFNHSQTLCGQLRKTESQFVFAEDADSIESAALVPLRRDGELIGILAVGSSDSSYFNRDMGTLFLEFVADVIARQLPGVCQA